MDFLRDAFAGVDDAVVDAVWEECGHDLEKAMEVLFDMTPPEAEAEEAHAAADLAPPAEDEDLRLAMELQRQFDEEERQRALESSAPAAAAREPLGMEAREMPDAQFAALLESRRALEQEINATQERVDRAAQLELDEQLARELMQEEHRAASGARPAVSDEEMARALAQAHEGAPSRHVSMQSLVGGGGGGGGGGLDLGDLLGGGGGSGGVSLEQMNEVIKESIIPTIVGEVQGFRLPAVDEQVDVPRLGEVQFSCSGSTMEEVTIPKEDVKLSIEGDVIRFKIRKMQAKLSKFDWRYAQSQFPKLKDKGKATARLDGASFEVAFRIGPQGAEVLESRVSVGKVRVSVSGTRKSIIYNVVIATVIGLLKPVVERELAKLVRAMLGDTGFTSDDDDDHPIGSGISGFLSP